MRDSEELSTFQEEALSIAEYLSQRRNAARGNDSHFEPNLETS
jgi:hypothetical protein